MHCGWISRSCATALTVAALAIAPATVAGETTGEPRAVRVERRDAVAWPATSKRYALVIGVDQYADSQMNPLFGAANDAKLMADALVRYAGFPAEQVILLASDQPENRQPTRGIILRRLSNLRMSVPHDGLLLVFFAGHGIERGEQAILLPSDSEVSNDVDLLEATAINVQELKAQIRRTGVGQVVVVIDACRNNPVAGRGEHTNPLSRTYMRGFDFDVRNREVTAFATLYATSVGAMAYENREKHQGYFTWELVEGLKGGAANDKGEVTLAGLVDYVQLRVPKRVLSDFGSGSEQKPFAVVGGYQANELVLAVAPTAAAVAESRALPQADPAAFELTYWETIEKSTDPEDFRSYLSQYPNGRFADLARRRSQAHATSTLASAFDTSSAPVAMKTGPATTVRNSPQGGLLLANVVILALDLGIVEIGAYQNATSAQISQTLTGARDMAASTGVATDQLDEVLRQLRAGAMSQGQYPSLVAARMALERAFDRTGNCGRPVNFRNAFGLGTQLGYMNVVSYQGADPTFMTQDLTLAIQYATASGFATDGLQAMLRQVSGGATTRDQYQPLLNLQQQLIQAANASCAW